MSSRSDRLAIVEAAYRPQASADAWFRNLGDAASDVMGNGEGCFVLGVNAVSDAAVDVGAMVLARCHPAIADMIHRSTLGQPPGERAATYGSPIVYGPISQRLGGRRAFGRHWLRREFQDRGWADYDLLRAFDPSGFGCFLGWASHALGAPSRRKVDSWSRVAAHVVAGLRLQRAVQRDLASGRGLLNSAEVEAVLTPEGAVADASGSARSTEARQRLRAAAACIDRARSNRGRRDEAAALSVWKGLVAGRWSMVDVFDSDGRRFILARPNEPATRRSPSLTKREQQVLAYAAMGHANKLIAYHLGLAASTVSEHLRRAREKVGVGSELDGRIILPRGVSIP